MRVWCTRCLDPDRRLNVRRSAGNFSHGLILEKGCWSLVARRKMNFTKTAISNDGQGRNYRQGDLSHMRNKCRARKCVLHQLSNMMVRKSGQKLEGSKSKNRAGKCVLYRMIFTLLPWPGSVAHGCCIPRTGACNRISKTNISFPNHEERCTQKRAINIFWIKTCAGHSVLDSCFHRNDDGSWMKPCAGNREFPTESLTQRLQFQHLPD